jgi:hypothetical protein
MRWERNGAEQDAAEKRTVFGGDERDDRPY